MAKKNLSSFVDREKVVAMCLRISSDKAIAKYLGCEQEHVATVRASLRVKREYDHDRKGDALGIDPGISASAAIGSRNLLIKQLKTGLHWLSPDQFKATLAMLRREGAPR